MSAPLSPLATMILTMAQQDRALRSNRAIWSAAPRGVSRKSVDAAVAELTVEGYFQSHGEQGAFWVPSPEDRLARLGQNTFSALVIGKLASLDVNFVRQDSVSFNVNMHGAMRLLGVLAALAPGDAFETAFRAANYNDPEQYDLTPESGADRY